MLGRLLFDQFALGGLGHCATPGTFPCCTCTTTICIAVNCPTTNIALQGATVTITGVGSCTTNASGCCTFSTFTTGSYTVTVVYQGVTVFSGTRTITACHTNNIVISVPAGFVCCWNCLIPTTLHVTDTNGTHTATLSGSVWSVCYLQTVTGVSVSGASGCGCACSASGSISMPIQYNITCASGTTNALTVQILWTGITCVSCGGCVSLTGPFTYFQPSNGCGAFGGFVDCVRCTSGVSNPFIDAFTVTQAWSACNPFSLSATVGSGTFTPSPVGASITVSS